MKKIATLCCAGTATALAFVTATGGFAQETTNTQQGLKLRVLQQAQVNLGNRALILNRVAPPVLPAPPPVLPPTLSAAQRAEERRLSEKKNVLLSLSLTVYDHRVTEIRWFDEQKHRFRAFSNIDFNYLAGAGHIETEDTVYSLNFAVGNESSEERESFNRNAAKMGLPKWFWKQIPPPETFSPKRSEYVIVENDAESPPSEEDLAHLDALHVYYDANRKPLEEGATNREAERIASQQWQREHPPVPKDTVINLWPKKSRVYSTARH